MAKSGVAALFCFIIAVVVLFSTGVAQFGLHWEVDLGTYFSYATGVFLLILAYYFSD